MKRLAVVISLSVAVCCANAQSARSAIESADKTVCKLMLAKDFRGFKTYLKPKVTKDFKYVEGGRTMNFDQMCQGVAMGFRQMKITKADSSVLTLKEKGSRATATISHTMESVAPGPDKKTHKISFLGLSTNVYVKQGDTWKLSSMTWGKQTMLMDGKPVATNVQRARK